MQLRIIAAAVIVLTLCAAVRLGAHITPAVVMRKQAAVIRETMPAAVSYFVTTVKIGKPELRRILDRAHYTPDADSVKFYVGKNRADAVVGMVVFPQIDTQHGPLEVGVTIGADGAVTSVLVTRASVEMKPWILEVERSGVLDRLKGTTAGDTSKRIHDDRLNGMPGYVAEAIATATYRALTLHAVLKPWESSAEQSVR